MIQSMPCVVPFWTTTRDFVGMPIYILRHMRRDSNHTWVMPLWATKVFVGMPIVFDLSRLFLCPQGSMLAHRQKNGGCPIPPLSTSLLQLPPFYELHMQLFRLLLLSDPLYEKAKKRRQASGCVKRAKQAGFFDMFYDKNMSSSCGIATGGGAGKPSPSTLWTSQSHSIDL